jgi:hypothetical protein
MSTTVVNGPAPLGQNNVPASVTPAWSLAKLTSAVLYGKGGIGS